MMIQLRMKCKFPPHITTVGFVCVRGVPRVGDTIAVRDKVREDGPEYPLLLRVNHVHWYGKHGDISKEVDALAPPLVDTVEVENVEEEPGELERLKIINKKQDFGWAEANSLALRNGLAEEKATTKLLAAQQEILSVQKRLKIMLEAKNHWADQARDLMQEKLAALEEIKTKNRSMAAVEVNHLLEKMRQEMLPLCDLELAIVRGLDLPHPKEDVEGALEHQEERDPLCSCLCVKGRLLEVDDHCAVHGKLEDAAPSTDDTGGQTNG